MTAARRPHPDDIALPSHVVVSGRSAGGKGRGDTVFHPSIGDVTQTDSGSGKAEAVHLGQRRPDC